MTKGRVRALCIAGAVLLTVVLVVGLFSGSAEQRRLNRARDAESAQESNLRAARRSTVGEQRALKAAYVTASTLAKHLVLAEADVALTQNDLTTAKGALDRARVVLTSQSSRKATVEQCLSGVKQALDATRARNTSAATAYLRAAAPACQAALTPPGEASPVLAYDFADPFVLRVGNDYYAYATNAAGGSVQMARSRDLTSWTLADNALSNIPSWATAGSVWAPAALNRSPVTVLYYTVREAATGRQCISVAVSGSPAGPFLDGSTGPLECAEHGAIDPSPFVDANGTPYLVYKTEQPPRIWSRPLTADGRAFAGPAQLLLAPSQRWEAGNVEAPSMLRNGSSYWLFYSGNDWNGRNYAEGIARCAGPVGPCTADGANPILASLGTAAGPGGGEVFTAPDGSWRLAYHAYQEPFVRYPNSRLLYFGRIGFNGSGVPTINR